MQQEAVALLESREIDGEIEGEGEGETEEGDVAEDGDNEEEAENAARALLGLPGLAKGTGTAPIWAMVLGAGMGRPCLMLCTTPRFVSDDFPRSACSFAAALGKYASTLTVAGNSPWAV